MINHTWNNLCKQCLKLDHVWVSYGAVIRAPDYIIGDHASPVGWMEKTFMYSCDKRKSQHHSDGEKNWQMSHSLFLLVRHVLVFVHCQTNRKECHWQESFFKYMEMTDCIISAPLLLRTMKEIWYWPDKPTAGYLGLVHTCVESCVFQSVALHKGIQKTMFFCVPCSQLQL